MRKDFGNAAETVRKDYGSSVDIVRTKCGATAVPLRMLRRSSLLGHHSNHLTDILLGSGYAEVWRMGQIITSSVSVSIRGISWNIRHRSCSDVVELY